MESKKIMGSRLTIMIALFTYETEACYLLRYEIKAVRWRLL